LTNNQNQAPNNNNPPIGVIGPRNLKFNPVAVLVVNKKIDPENKIVPNKVR
jgi:hypothetical protein